SGFPVLTWHQLDSITSLPSQIVLVERLSDEGFNDCLSADVELSCCCIEFIEHLLAKVDVDSLDRWHHLARVRKILRYILSPVGELCNDFSRDRFRRFTSCLHIVFVLPSWRSRV